METSLKYAIAKAKRNIVALKYSKIENVVDAAYEYYIRTDEVDGLMKSVNRYIEKHSPLYGLAYNITEIEIIKSLVKDFWNKDL